jgi:hypothetical protein
MSVDVPAPSPRQFRDPSHEETAMNSIPASRLDRQSSIDVVMTAAAPLWLLMAGILAAAMGACPLHLYI